MTVYPGKINCFERGVKLINKGFYYQIKKKNKVTENDERLGIRNNQYIIV